MYSIYADDLCIYDDRYLSEDTKVLSPTLTLSDNTAGQLVVTLPPTNVGYDYVVRMVTDISVRKNDEEIWAGRVLSEEKDFWNNRKLTCEGELAFFNDSTQPPAEYHDITVRGFLNALVGIHNAKVDTNRQFTVGIVTVVDPNDSLYRYTNYEKTIECINDKLLDRLGGHLRVRKENGVRYLDYLDDYPNINSQEITFGKNLLDFTRTWDATEFATVLVPLGARLDESPIEALEAYLTVASVNQGSIYVVSEAVEEYGWIEKVVHWDDVTDAQNLLNKAEQYLSETQFDNLSIELSALDLNYLDVNYEAVKLLDKIRVVSKPHGLDRYFPVTELEIPLDAPETSQFSLGDKVSSGNFTSVNNAINNDILKKIDEIPTEYEILEEAKASATEIMNMATNGYITITQDGNGTDAFYISNTRDYTHATKLWKWNINGLGYSNDGGSTYGLAMTMDGSIVADRITSGTLNGDVIRAGIIRDVNSKVVFNLNAGTLTINKGSINLGSGKFTVNDSGSMSANSGNIGDFTISSGTLSSIGVDIRYSGVDIKDLDNGKTLGSITQIGDTFTFGAGYDSDGILIGTQLTQGGQFYPLLDYNRSTDKWTFYRAFDGAGQANPSNNLWLNPNNCGVSGGITGSISIGQSSLEFKNGFLVGVN